MKKLLKTAVFVFSLVLSISVSIFSQTKTSEIAYFEWKAKQTAAGIVIPDDHLGIAFSASKCQDAGTKVEMSLFAGNAVSQLPALEFSVQPLQSSNGTDGKFVFADVGVLAKIRSPQLTLQSRAQGVAILQPEIITRIPSNANALRILIRGFGNGEEAMTVILPINQTMSSAVITTAMR
jgi:hypothetical protein